MKTIERDKGDAVLDNGEAAAALLGVIADACSVSG